MEVPVVWAVVALLGVLVIYSLIRNWGEVYILALEETCGKSREDIFKNICVTLFVIVLGLMVVAGITFFSHGMLDYFNPDFASWEIYSNLSSEVKNEIKDGLKYREDYIHPVVRQNGLQNIGIGVGLFLLFGFLVWTGFVIDNYSTIKDSNFKRNY